LKGGTSFTSKNLWAENDLVAGSQGRLKRQKSSQWTEGKGPNGPTFSPTQTQEGEEGDASPMWMSVSETQKEKPGAGKGVEPVKVRSKKLGSWDFLKKKRGDKQITPDGERKFRGVATTKRPGETAENYCTRKDPGQETCKKKKRESKM